MLRKSIARGSRLCTVLCWIVFSTSLTSERAKTNSIGLALSISTSSLASVALGNIYPSRAESDGCMHIFRSPCIFTIINSTAKSSTSNSLNSGWQPPLSRTLPSSLVINGPFIFRFAISRISLD
ncbi:hypothetical protein O181_010735 [Austropuccinia psidii MF-1]|uniref:Secreted protein n=1 Tax=Austropuccinia psidii MF-1 TaxID=1389203 RepID=A0A9Q3BTT4_9BASI|nr:hypothetical protein [Austropuccinia psidii MF-1]